LRGIIFSVVICILLIYGCRSVESAEPERELESAAAETKEEEPSYYAGATIIVKPGKVRTVGVNYHSDNAVDSSLYVWTATDGTVISIMGMGSKCTIIGKKEGESKLVAINPDVPFPYSFRVICTADEAVVKKFQKSKSERTEGRLVSGWSNLELVESRKE